jgi:hypothetical protein
MDGSGQNVAAVERPRIVLICHHGDLLNHDALGRWLASFADLAGIVVLHETRARAWRRIRREIRRVGLLRFCDVLAFRLHYRLTRRRHDKASERALLQDLQRCFPPIPPSTRVLDAPSPNTPAVQAFLRECSPDLVIARCKTLLKPETFSIARRGTFAMHPGICPQYRNAHGCFWALARNDPENVGMTLLKIDPGVDTGAVYGYYRCEFDELRESHILIQHRTVFDNLDRIREKLLEIAAGRANPLNTAGKPSKEWGQPWWTANRALRKWAIARRSHADQPSLS